MKRLLISSLVLLAACSPTVTEQPKPTTSIGESVLKLDLSELTTPPHICFINKLSDWPVDEAIANWNRNGTVLFVRDKPCRAKVVLKPVVTKKFSGETSFGTETIVIYMDKDLPSIYRRHVLCHELGHVLGLAHNKYNSCMNNSLHVERPTVKELESISKFDDWSIDLAWKAANLGHG